MPGALRSILAKFGFEITDSNKLTDAEKKADGLTNAIKGISGAILGSALLDTVKSFIREIQGAGDAISDTSARLGIGTDELQRWQYAAQLSGASAESINTALLILQKNAAAAAEGGGAAAEVFAALGVPIKTAAGDIKSSGQLMGDVGLEIAKLKNPSERTAAALKVFGKQGAALLPIFDGGEEKLSKLLDRFDELGGGYSEDALEGIGSLGDAIDDMGYATTSLKSRLAITLFPALSEWIGYLTKTVVWLAKTSEGTHVIQAAIGVLGAAAIAIAIKTYAAWLPWIAAIGLAVLLIDDLWTLFKGGDSAIGRLIDSIGGIGTAKKAIQDLIAWWNKFTGDWAKAGTLWQKIKLIFFAYIDVLKKLWIDWIPALWGKLWSLLSAAVKTSGPVLWSDIKKLFSDIGNWFKDWATSVGTSVWEGIVEGIEKGEEFIKEAFKDLGEKGWKSFKDFFKISSPARLPQEDTEDIGDGVVIGLARQHRKIKNANRELAEVTRPEFDSASYAPSLSPHTSSIFNGGASVAIHQVNHNEINVTGSGNAGVAEAARSGVSQAHSEDRRAAVAALETAVE